MRCDDGRVRDAGVHALLGTNQEGRMGGQTQDRQGPSAPSAAEHRPMVSAESTQEPARTTGGVESQAARATMRTMESPGTPRRWPGFGNRWAGGGASGSVGAAEAGACHGNDSGVYSRPTLCPKRESCTTYDVEQRTHCLTSRMVAISLSGSGEGLGRAIARGYSTGFTQPPTSHYHIIVRFCAGVHYEPSSQVNPGGR